MEDDRNARHQNDPSWRLPEVVLAQDLSSRNLPLVIASHERPEKARPDQIKPDLLADIAIHPFCDAEAGKGAGMPNQVGSCDSESRYRLSRSVTAIVTVGRIGSTFPRDLVQREADRTFAF